MLFTVNGKSIKPGIKGVKDRLAMLQAAKDRGALKNEDVDLLSDLYDQLDESNQEIHKWMNRYVKEKKPLPKVGPHGA